MRSILCFIAIILTLVFAGDVVIQIEDPGGGRSGTNARAAVTDSMRLRQGLISGTASLVFLASAFVLYRGIKKKPD